MADARRLGKAGGVVGRLCFRALPEKAPARRPRCALCNDRFKGLWAAWRVCRTKRRGIDTVGFGLFEAVLQAPGIVQIGRADVRVTGAGRGRACMGFGVYNALVSDKMPACAERGGPDLFIDAPDTPMGENPFCRRARSGNGRHNPAWCPRARQRPKCRVRPERALRFGTAGWDFAVRLASLQSLALGKLSPGMAGEATHGGYA